VLKEKMKTIMFIPIYRVLKGLRENRGHKAPQVHKESVVLREWGFNIIGTGQGLPLREKMNQHLLHT